jgi:hypothetical protein
MLVSVTERRSGRLTGKTETIGCPLFAEDRLPPNSMGLSMIHLHSDFWVCPQNEP